MSGATTAPFTIPESPAALPVSPLVMTSDFSHLTRPRHPMPDDVRDALAARGLRDAYEQRPAYQQNDYLAWIGRAKRPETRQRRLAQMLDELEAGGVYMKMDHPASRRT